MTLIASIITFSKKNFGKKNVTLDPQNGTLALDMEPSTLDPRQKDRLQKSHLLSQNVFLQSIIYLSEKKNSLKQAAFWHE